MFLDGPEIPQAAIIFDPNCNLPRLYVNVVFIIEIKSFSAHKKSKIDGVSGATNMYIYFLTYNGIFFQKLRFLSYKMI